MALNSLESQININLLAKDNTAAAIGSAKRNLRALKTEMENFSIPKIIFPDSGITPFAQAFKNADFTGFTKNMSALSSATPQLTQGMLGMDTVLNKVAVSAKATSVSVENLGKTIIRTVITIRAAIFGLVMVFGWMKGAIEAAREANNSMTSLAMAASNFGLSATKALDVAKQLSADGLMPLYQSANQVNQLISAGLGFNEINELMANFRDIAAFSTTGADTFQERMDKLTESFVTGRSIIANAGGLYENWNETIAIGAKIMGVATAAMSYDQKVMAMQIGLKEIALRAEGNYNKMLETTEGVLTRASSATNKLQVTAGTILMPVLLLLIKGFLKTGDAGKLLIGVFKVLAGALAAIAGAIRIVVATINAAFLLLVGGIESIMTLSWDPFVERSKEAWSGIADAGVDTFKALTAISIDGTAEITDNIKDVDRNWAKMGKNAAKAMRDIQKENANFAKDMAKRAVDFKRSLADMMFAHQDKKKSLEKDLADETASYTRENAKRLEDYNDTLAKMQKNYTKKIGDIEKKTAEENRKFTESQADKNRSLREELRKGVYIYDQFNAEVNNNRIEDLKRSISEEKADHQRRLDDLKADMDEEKQDYIDALAEKKKAYDEDKKEAQIKYDEKKADLQKSLDEEVAILEKHKGRLNEIKDLQREDDITSLIRRFEEEKVAAEAAHIEKLADIKRQASEEGAAFGPAMTKSLTNGISTAVTTATDAANKQVDEWTNVLGEKAKEAGKAFGEGILTGAWEGFKNKIKEHLNKQAEHITGTSGTVEVGNMGFLEQFMLGMKTARKLQHGGIVPGMPNQAVPMMLHGGERVVSSTGADAGLSRTVTVNFNGNMVVDNPERVRQVAAEVVRLMGRQNELARLGAGY